MKNTQKQKKATKSEMTVFSTIQDVAHKSATDILRLRTVADCELSMVEHEIDELTIRLSNARSRRKKITDTLAGYAVAISRR